LTTGSWPPIVTRASQKRDIAMDQVVLVAWLVVVVGATLRSPFLLMKLYWIPLFLYHPVLFALSLPEHYKLANESSDSETRSVVSNSLVRFVTWNAGLHREHHAFPGIPAVNLLEVHRSLRSSGGVENTERSIVAFHAKIIRSLRQKNPSVCQPAGE
jgi:fatty acid desaturase